MLEDQQFKPNGIFRDETEQLQSIRLAKKINFDLNLNMSKDKSDAMKCNTQNKLQEEQSEIKKNLEDIKKY